MAPGCAGIEKTFAISELGNQILQLREEEGGSGAERPRKFSVFMSQTRHKVVFENFLNSYLRIRVM